MDDFEARLQRELQRVAGEARGPAPRAAQARYRQARPSMFVVSRLAVGLATVAFAFGASVVAAAAFSGSGPTEWGQAVKLAVQRCQVDEGEPGGELGACVGSFVPSGLPIPTALRPSDSGQNGSQQGGGRGGNSSGGSQSRSANSNSRQQSGAAASGQGSSSALPSSQLPNTSGSQPASLGPASAPSPGVPASPQPSGTPLVATPAPTPTPTQAPTPPPPTPTPTAAGGSGGNVPPTPTPDSSPPPTPTPTASP